MKRYCGLDVHKDSVFVCIMDENGIVFQKKFGGRVAMCGGSGRSLIGAAMKSGAQLYVSGDISYHDFFTEKGFMIMDIGHYESEIEIVDILFSLLRKNFPTFAVRITQNIYSNPIFYF